MHANPRRPPVHYETESPGVGESLQAVITTVLAGGGRLHPGLRLVERAGQFSAYCDPIAGAGDQPLFRLPRKLLIPVQSAVWEQCNDALRLSVAPDDLTPLQRDLLNQQVALYNAAGKIPWALNHMTSLVLDGQAPLRAALEAIWPGFANRPATPAEAFLRTRTFCDRSVTGKDGSGQLLMPLIDLLNHHHRGARFRMDDINLVVRVVQPTVGLECFAIYGGRRDVLDLALHYGYADPCTPLAFCAPLRVDVPGLGQLRVEALRPTLCPSSGRPVVSG
ncbi:hypothetical protein [uncultured Thiodictyon sp.]|uniref:hypothetical protein n=1 Tax=uncultured Thiodictyon sp. TaxID=1846217 RepID=UPI0025F987E7|nr:hypothetical protein [uncultured Thiodictyon sp.]